MHTFFGYRASKLWYMHCLASDLAYFCSEAAENCENERFVETPRAENCGEKCQREEN